jgi:hypothetical protein
MQTGKLSAESLPRTSGFDDVITLTDAVNLTDFLRELADIFTANSNPTAKSTKLASIFHTVINSADEKIENFLYATIKELGMNMRNVVLRFNRVRSSAGFMEDGRQVLNIDVSLDFNTIQFVILHELRHIQQVQRGWLTHNTAPFQTFWKGRPIRCSPMEFASNLAYCMSPQELDANIFALAYFTGNPYTVQSGENAIGIAKEYTARHQWLESIGVP